VEEHDIPDMFGTSSFMVMPYTSATGASGVANLAAAYGVPIICSDIPDFREMGDSGGLAINFIQWETRLRWPRICLSCCKMNPSSMKWRNRTFPLHCA